MKNYQILILALIALAAIAGSTLATITYRNRTDDALKTNNPLPQPTTLESTPTPTLLASVPPQPTSEKSSLPLPTESLKPVLIIPKNDDSFASSPSRDSEANKFTDNQSLAANQPANNSNLETNQQIDNSNLDFNQPDNNSPLETNQEIDNSNLETSQPIENPNSLTNQPINNQTLAANQQSEINKNQSKASEFSQFRLRLLDAINRRDYKFIYAIATPETQWNYGGTLNLNNYKIDDKQSKFWDYLEKSVSVGCEIDGNSNKVKNKEAGSDIWNCPGITQVKKSIQPNKSNQGRLAIVGQNINIRSEPGTGGQIVDVVSNEFVELDSQTFNSLPQRMQEEIKAQVTNSWTPVKLNNGKRGWVQNLYLYDEEKDYRTSFVRSRGQWRLRYFLPGDGN